MIDTQQHSVSKDQTVGAVNQFLTFVSAGEEYGIEILNVQEIKGWRAVTRVPNSPPHVLGVLNLRGAVVPVVDLRVRLGIERIPYGPTTVVIVVRVEHESNEQTVAMVVDAVNDVLSLDDGAIHPAPDIASVRVSRCVCGIATAGERMVILLDTNKLLDLSSDVGLEAQTPTPSAGSSDDETHPARPPGPSATAPAEVATF